MAHSVTTAMLGQTAPRALLLPLTVTRNRDLNCERPKTEEPTREVWVSSQKRSCVNVCFFTSKQVIHLLPSWFFQVLAERWKSQLEVVPVTDSTPVTSLAPCFH